MKSRLRTALVVAGALAVVLVLVGCSSGKADTSTLEGSWVLESFGGVTAVVPADPAVTSELTLEAGQASGNGGVNSFSGTYEASSDSKISFGPLAATAMAGSPAAMDQESKFFAGLEKAKRWEIDAGKLVLGDIGNNTVMILVAK